MDTSFQIGIVKKAIQTSEWLGIGTIFFVGKKQSGTNDDTII